jgi:hypothetical protein
MIGSAKKSRICQELGRVRLLSDDVRKLEVTRGEIRRQSIPPSRVDQLIASPNGAIDKALVGKQERSKQQQEWSKTRIWNAGNVSTKGTNASPTQGAFGGDMRVVMNEACKPLQGRMRERCNGNECDRIGSSGHVG